MRVEQVVRTDGRQSERLLAAGILARRRPIRGAGGVWRHVGGHDVASTGGEVRAEWFAADAEAKPLRPWTQQSTLLERLADERELPQLAVITRCVAEALHPGQEPCCFKAVLTARGRTSGDEAARGVSTDRLRALAHNSEGGVVSCRASSRCSRITTSSRAAATDAACVASATR